MKNSNIIARLLSLEHYENYQKEERLLGSSTYKYPLFCPEAFLLGFHIKTSTEVRHSYSKLKDSNNYCRTISLGPKNNLTLELNHDSKTFSID